MTVFNVPLRATVYSSILVHAESIEDAYDKAFDQPFPSVEDGQYDEVDTWEVDHENIEEVN
nr:MAG TPA: protein of unknown function (DUF4288) [Caudoviricetes sp.]